MQVTHTTRTAKHEAERQRYTRLVKPSGLGQSGNRICSTPAAKAGHQHAEARSHCCSSPSGEVLPREVLGRAHEDDGPARVEVEDGAAPGHQEEGNLIRKHLRDVHDAHARLVEVAPFPLRARQGARRLRVSSKLQAPARVKGGVRAEKGVTGKRAAEHRVEPREGGAAAREPSLRNTGARKSANERKGSAEWDREPTPFQYCMWMHHMPLHRGATGLTPIGLAETCAEMGTSSVSQKSAATHRAGARLAAAQLLFLVSRTLADVTARCQSTSANDGGRRASYTLRSGHIVVGVGGGS